MSEQEERIWYYATTAGDRFGPYSEEELIRLLQKGLVRAEDYIWVVDFETWMNVGKSIYSFYLPVTRN